MWLLRVNKPSNLQTELHNYYYVYIQYRVQNNSQPLAIFQPISLFDQSNLTLAGYIYCTFAMECKVTFF